MVQVATKWLVYSPNELYEEHTHSEAQITLFVSGGVEEKVGDECCSIGPLEVVVKPAGLPHMDRFWRRGAQTIQISLDRQSAESWGIAEGLPSYRIGFSPAVAHRLLSLFLGPQSCRKAVASEDRFSDLLRDIRSAVSPASSPQRMPDWLDLVVQQIDLEYHQRISVLDLARQYEKHPVSLARSFRARYGQSITQRIGHLRVQRAARQLCESDRSAAAIAQSCGFSDQSHMNRVFKGATGVPPVKFRRFVCEKKFQNVSYVQE